MTDDILGNQGEAKQALEEVAKTIKIGEEELSLEEAQALISLGKQGKELSDKYNVPMEKIWPNHQKIINENKELREKIDEIEKTTLQQRQEQGQPLSPEEQARLVRDELRKHGVVLKEDLDTLVKQEFIQTKEAEKLLSEVDKAIADLEKDYGIKTTDKDLLGFMQENGGTPKSALKLMFEDKIDEIKAQRLSELKPQGFTTIESSQAGAKEPAEVRVTKENLGKVLHEFFEGVKAEK